MANLVWPICIHMGDGRSADAVFLFFSADNRPCRSVVVSG
jgi:hypothetical protein